MVKISSFKTKISFYKKSFNIAQIDYTKSAHKTFLSKTQQLSTITILPLENIQAQIYTFLQQTGVYIRSIE